eukprot:7988077-Pyramimonas_sp.AAC.1
MFKYTKIFNKDTLEAGVKLYSNEKVGGIVKDPKAEAYAIKRMQIDIQRIRGNCRTGSRLQSWLLGLVQAYGEAPTTLSPSPSPPPAGRTTPGSTAKGSLSGSSMKQATKSLIRECDSDSEEDDTVDCDEGDCAVLGAVRKHGDDHAKSSGHGAKQPPLHADGADDMGASFQPVFYWDHAQSTGMATLQDGSAQKADAVYCDALSGMVACEFLFDEREGSTKWVTEIP